MNKCFVIIVCFFLASCSTSVSDMASKEVVNSRGLASIETHGDLVKLLDEIEAAVEVGVKSTNECTTKLKYYYSELFNVKSSKFDPNLMSYKTLNDVVNKSFKTRVDILKILKSVHLKSSEDIQCLDQIKSVVRALRYVEDYFIEVRYTRSGEMDSSEFESLEGEGLHFLKTDKFSNFEDYTDLKSGDVILSRGNAASSAAIARIGINDTQFSHISLVYIDDQNVASTIEAHIEVGSVVAPLHVHLNQKNSRTVVYRHADSVLAHRAAQIMFNRVKKQQDTGENIQYDFGMDYRDTSKLFCSEVVSLGYQLAAKERKEEFDVPLYKTKFNKGLVSFLNILGIKISNKNFSKFKTFGPGDIQFDPRFDMVAEWRNPKKLQDTRMKDTILTKIFTWMEKDGYMFDHSASVSVTSNLFWLMRKVPYLNEVKDLNKQFPLNMNVGQLKLFRTLDVVVDLMTERLLVKQKENKRILSPLDMYHVLDEYMAEDAKKYELYKKFKKSKSRAYDYSERSNAHSGMKRNKPDFHINFHN